MLRERSQLILLHASFLRKKGQKISKLLGSHERGYNSSGLVVRLTRYRETVENAGPEERPLETESGIRRRLCLWRDDERGVRLRARLRRDNQGRRARARASNNVINGTTNDHGGQVSPLVLFLHVPHIVSPLRQFQTQGYRTLTSLKNSQKLTLSATKQRMY